MASLGIAPQLAQVGQYIVATARTRLPGPRPLIGPVMQFTSR
jgi:hypothetical protein